jgi:hypothetical protein
MLRMGIEVESVSGPASGQLIDASTIFSNLHKKKLDPASLREIGEVLAPPICKG